MIWYPALQTVTATATKTAVGRNKCYTDCTYTVCIHCYDTLHKPGSLVLRKRNSRQFSLNTVLIILTDMDKNLHNVFLAVLFTTDITCFQLYSHCMSVTLTTDKNEKNTNKIWQKQNQWRQNITSIPTQGCLTAWGKVKGSTLITLIFGGPNPWAYSQRVRCGLWDSAAFKMAIHAYFSRQFWPVK